jgi:protein gp37
MDRFDMESGDRMHENQSWMQELAVRFLSVEPLLGPIARLPLQGIHWVIVGGESGPGARTIDPGWVRKIRDRCIVQGVPFFSNSGVERERN